MPREGMDARSGECPWMGGMPREGMDARSGEWLSLVGQLQAPNLAL